MTLNKVDGFLIDIDGTVFRGSQPIEGAIETIAWLKRIGKKVALVSNRGNISREMCRARFRQFGLDLHTEDIVLSSSVIASFIHRYYASNLVWTLGDTGLREELLSWGVRQARKPEDADWLIVTLHETITYRDLNDAFRAVRSGARIVATNRDRSFPGEDGECIDVAGMVGAIEAATGKSVELVAGKPSTLMADAALTAVGLPADQCLMIGDSLESDIALGNRHGMLTALVLSGSSTREHTLANPMKPNYIWESLAELRTWA
ncbi:HAD-IIA family hydrolase [Paenibacillus sp. TRM 82003]|nr:HAD-IIA family hydrolase [Paenibacillus sp. TRM 82003]